MNSLLLIAQGNNDTRAIIMIVIATAILIALIGLFAVMANFFWLWAQSFTTGAGIGLLDLIGMWFRRVDARSIVRSKIMAVQAGFGDEEVSSQALEAHYLAGGNVPQVIRALIAARKSKTITLGFREATAIDLAGRDVLEAVQTSVYPKVIDCPPRGAARTSLDAVAKNGAHSLAMRPNQRVAGDAPEAARA